MQTYIKQNRKRSDFDVELLLRILLVMLIILAVAITIDLYVPLKMLIMGYKLNFSDLITHIKFRQHLPYVFIIGNVVGFYWDKSVKENSNG